ncbi:MAG: Zn-dependent exopeptidase M28 [Bacteroidales bacterium]|nr:Zn-dependent exopeptidase M28 [Bacteroidales bacterium]
MKRLFLLSVFLICTIISVNSQDKVIKKVLELGKSDNTTMDHIDILANRIGGRLIGSHALTDAENWVISKFEEWGIEYYTQEVGSINVGFNRGPWFGRMLSEDGMQLHFATPAYTAGTKGRQIGHVLIEPKSQAELARMKGALKGAWVLISGKSNGNPIDNSPQGDKMRAGIIAKNDSITRLNSEIRAYNYANRDNPKEMIPYIECPAMFYKEMVEAGVLGFIQSTSLPMTILADRKNAWDITYDNLPTVCDIKLDEHQYKIIEQKVKERQTFFLEFDIRNHFSIGPIKYRNVIGVIKGSKYPDEYVMLGAHVDAYDIGTGAVDDANGCAVVLEAARLLSMSGAKPKRTILFCIWTGEEFGLLGSKYFVENKTVDMEKISNYFNRDGGPLCATGINVPEAMYKDFVKAAAPLEDYSEEFPFRVNKRQGEPRRRPTTPGGSDHAYFAMNGVPTISFSETDHKGYNFSYGEIWHTENDLYQKVFPDYMEHSSVVAAVIVYGIANLDHLLSREGLYKE